MDIDFNLPFAVFADKEPSKDEMTEIIYFLRHHKSPIYRISVTTRGFSETLHVEFYIGFPQIFLFSVSRPEHLENIPVEEEICLDIGNLIGEAFANTTMNLHDEYGETTVETGLHARYLAGVISRPDGEGLSNRDRYLCFNFTLGMERLLYDKEFAAVYAIVGTKLSNDVKVDLFEIVDSTGDDEFPFAAKFTTSNITSPQQLHALYNLLTDFFPEDINFGPLSLDV